jgi:hypothetical protein
LERRLRILLEVQDNASKKITRLGSNLSLTQNRLSAINALGLQNTAIGKYTISQLKQQAVVQKESMRMQKRAIALRKVEINQMNRQSYMANRFRMEYLGIMFAGMMVQRLMLNFWRNAAKVYNDAFEETSALEKMTNKLASAWQFFQFRLMDALSQSPLFANMIEFLVQLSNRLSALSVESILTIAFTGIRIAVAATAAFVLGSLVLAGSSLARALGIAGGFWGAFGAIGLFATLGFFITEVMFDVSEGKYFEALGSALASLGIIMITKHPLAGTVILSLGLLIKILPQVHELDKTFESIKEQFKTQSEEKFAEGEFFLGGIFDFFSRVLGERGVLTGPISTLSEMYDKMSDNEVKVGQLASAVDTKVKEVIKPAFEKDLVGSAQKATESVEDTKAAIDEIPDETHKWIYIHTVHTGEETPDVEELPT